MAPNKKEKIGRWVVIGICITTYVFFIYNVLAAYLTLLGDQSVNPLLT
jgi:hypothetical protein